MFFVHFYVILAENHYFCTNIWTVQLFLRDNHPLSGAMDKSLKLAQNFQLLSFFRKKEGEWIGIAKTRT